MDITTHVWTEEEKELVAILLNTVNENKKITYGEVSEKMSSRPNPHLGLRTPLYHVGLLCHQLGLPFISSMVVTKDGEESGVGLRPVFQECGKDIPELSDSELFKRERIAVITCNKWHLLADYFDLKIDMYPKGEVIYADEVSDDEKKYVEGQPTKVTVNQYERNRIARQECIEYYGKNGRICCQICGFDFGKFYGEDYTNIIEVHHIKPLSEIKKGYRINPTKDLIPVCPNCHTVLHSRVGESVKDLQARLKK